MAKIFYQEDCNLSLLEGKTIAIFTETDCVRVRIV